MRTGLKPADVTAVFVTHEHADHWAGINHFADARWLASPGVAEILNNNGKPAKKFEDLLPADYFLESMSSRRLDIRNIITAFDSIAKACRLSRQGMQLPRGFLSRATRIF